METKEFNDNIVKNRLSMIERIFSLKAKEYARGDRLSNFKVVAKFVGLTPEKVCLVWVLKHIEALKSFVNDLDEGILQSPERWTEKIGDTINYMILLEALIIERQQVRNSDTSIPSTGSSSILGNVVDSAIANMG